MKLILPAAAFAALFAHGASATPLTFGSVTVDTSTGPSTAVVGGDGRSGTFNSNASASFTGVTSIGEAAGGGAGSALFIGDRFNDAQDGSGQTTPTFQFLTGTVLVNLSAPIFNNPGDDFAIFVSGQNNSLSLNGFEETVSARVGGSGGAFWYNAALDFTPTLTNGDNVFGFWTYTYDLDDLGVGALDSIASIEIANFSHFATVTGGAGDGSSGAVDPTGLDGVPITSTSGLGGRFATPGTGGSCIAGSGGIPTGATGNGFCLSGVFGGNTFERFDTDPDLLYVAGLNGSGTAAVVPVPAALPLMLTGLAGFGLLARRRAARV